MKIFIVTQGFYSDYHIKGVFSTLEKALEAREFWGPDSDYEDCEKANYGFNDIEEYELDIVGEEE